MSFAVAVAGRGPRPSEGCRTRVSVHWGGLVEATRAVVPVLFRGQPEGAIVLAEPSRDAIDFARAAGQLAIAVSNARAYAALQHLARELTERNAALVKQRDQLQEMNRLKSEFLANVSHELRTPLNAILGYTELIHEGIYGPTTGEQNEALDGVDESSRNLLTLINQILDLSKVESGKIEIYVTEVRDARHRAARRRRGAGAPARQVAARSTVVAPRRASSSRPTPPRCSRSSPTWCRTPIKFTDKGSVTIELSADPRRRLHHRGQGHRHRHPPRGSAAHLRGVPPGRRLLDAPLLGHRPRPGDRAPLRAPARRHDHRREPVGVGSTFTLTLPPEPRRAPAGAAPGAQSGRISATMPAVPPSSPPGRRSEQAMTQDRAARRGQPAQPQDLQRHARPTPASPSSRPRTATRRSPASTAQLPDVILMDLSIPGVDGWEVTRRLKADARTQKVPIIALTAHAMRGDEERARAAGCDDYLSKPISPKKVVEEVKEYLEGKPPPL